MGLSGADLEYARMQAMAGFYAPDNIIAEKVNEVGSSAREAVLDAVAQEVNFADPPSGGNDQPGLQALVNAMATNNGGTVQLRKGTYRLDTPLVIPNKVIVRGQGRASTVLSANTGFTGAYMVRLGTESDEFAFSTRIEHVNVNCNGRVATGVYSAKGQEMTGASYCIISGWTQYGIDFIQGVDNFNVDNVELYPDASGAIAGFRGTNNYGANYLNRITIGVSGNLTMGMHLNGGLFNCQSVHVELCTDGIRFDGAAGSVMGMSSSTVGITLTNMVHIMSNTRAVTLANISGGGATNLVLDDFNFVTIPKGLNGQEMLPFYSAAETVIGRATMEPEGDGMSITGFIRHYISGYVNGMVMRVIGEPNDRFFLSSSGEMQWSDGTNGPDVLLYRNAPGQLRTNTKLTAVQGIGVGNSAAATTLGAVSRKMEVFDAAGNSIGFVPIYNSIT